MGIYDRDYYRQERPRWTASGPRSAVGILIIVNVVVYAADWIFLDGRLSENLSLSVDTLAHPWQWWQFLTYGFLHDRAPAHIVFNMLGLFFWAGTSRTCTAPRSSSGSTWR
jgi:membrane associated rhomboid family serine protease